MRDSNLGCTDDKPNTLSTQYGVSLCCHFDKILLLMIKIKKVLNFILFFKNHLWKYKCMLIYCYLIWDWVQGVTVHVWIVQWFLLIRSILNIESFVCISLRVCKNNIILKVFYIHWHLDTEILTHECLWLRYNCRKFNIKTM